MTYLTWVIIIGMVVVILGLQVAMELASVKEVLTNGG